MTNYLVNYDIITGQDANKEVRGHSITVHNQGSTVVRVNEDFLLPDDQLIIEAPSKNSNISMRFILRFGQPMATPSSPTSPLPQLYPGNRIAIKTLEIRD